jgi:hypothetical protein
VRTGETMTLEELRERFWWLGPPSSKPIVRTSAGRRDADVLVEQRTAI